MNYLSLVVEFHHPMPRPGEPAGEDWASASVETYWPLLRVVSELSRQRVATGLILAISPSWSALASDPDARDRTCAELDRRAATSAYFQELRQFVYERWDVDALELLRFVGDARTIELIPTTSSATWIPSLACEPILARAQVHLAALDHTHRFGAAPEGIWLPFLSYLPGLESTIAESRIRYFGVPADAFLRGTVLPPYGLDHPVITPPGVAAFAVRTSLASAVDDPSRRYSHDPRYRAPDQMHAAAAEHAAHFLSIWRETGPQGPGASRMGTLFLTSLSAHRLGGDWRGGPLWLSELLRRAAAGSDRARPITLGHYLDRYPEGVLGQPGPTAGGPLSVRPEGASIPDRCRTASETLAEALIRRCKDEVLETRCVAQMTRSLLLAQALDWATVPRHEIAPSDGLARADRHLQVFHELAGSLASGRLDAARLAILESGPSYLAEIDLNLLE